MFCYSSVTVKSENKSKMSKIKLEKAVTLRRCSVKRVLNYREVEQIQQPLVEAFNFET